MGMCAHLEQISAEQLSAYVRNPRAAYDSFLSEMTEAAGDMLPQMLAGITEAAEKQNFPPEIRKQIEQQLAQFQKVMNRSKGPRLVTAPGGRAEAVFSREGLAHAPLRSNRYC